jgi:hypothetical protein
MPGSSSSLSGLSLHLEEDPLIADEAITTSASGRDNEVEEWGVEERHNETSIDLFSLKIARMWSKFNFKFPVAQRFLVRIRESLRQQSHTYRLNGALCSLHFV